jgi:hypothetical protein
MGDVDDSNVDDEATTIPPLQALPAGAARRVLDSESDLVDDDRASIAPFLLAEEKHSREEREKRKKKEEI